MCSQKKIGPHLLSLVDYHNDLLRQVTEPVTFPLSKEDKQLIRDMKYSIQSKQLKKAGAPWKSAAGMAANQWGFNKRIFLYCPEGDTINNLRVIINPSYKPLNALINHPEQESMWESCFSVPLATGQVIRYTHIQIQFQNEEGSMFEQTLSGYNARVWQHENDHLDGFLYDDPRTKKCIQKLEFKNIKEVDEFFKRLSSSE